MAIIKKYYDALFLLKELNTPFGAFMDYFLMGAITVLVLLLLTLIWFFRGTLLQLINGLVHFLLSLVGVKVGESRL